jgi:hypothetical protein
MAGAETGPVWASSCCAMTALTKPEGMDGPWWVVMSRGRVAA